MGFQWVAFSFISINFCVVCIRALMCTVPGAFKSRVLWALSCFANFKFPGYSLCLNSAVSVHGVSNGYFEKVFCCWRTCVRAGVGPRGSGRRQAPGVGTGGGSRGGACHWAVGGEGAAEKRLLLVVGSQAGNQAPLHRGQCATPWKWEQWLPFALLATITWKLLL